MAVCYLCFYCYLVLIGVYEGFRIGVFGNSLIVCRWRADSCCASIHWNVVGREG